MLTSQAAGTTGHLPMLRSDTTIIEDQMGGKIASMLATMEIPSVTKILVMTLEMHRTEGRASTRDMMEIDIRR
jgi:hypothetical protein